ncbi:MAG: hypothetical protein JOZ99_10860, partial [Actinobacteria bacterium]|nr:hypothetical protein [Actinomycetota bacterium]
MAATVLVDASHLGGASTNRGIGTYLRELLPRLARQPGIDIVALAKRTGEPLSSVSAARIRRVAPGRFAQREHEFLLPLDLARVARATHADVVFSPADDPPWWSPRPWVQMLHDVIPLAAP